MCICYGIHRMPGYLCRILRVLVSQVVAAHEEPVKGALVLSTQEVLGIEYVGKDGPCLDSMNITFATYSLMLLQDHLLVGINSSATLKLTIYKIIFL